MKNPKLAQATLASLHDLGHKVVAEGVESAEVARVLREAARPGAGILVCAAAGRP